MMLPRRVFGIYRKHICFPRRDKIGKGYRLRFRFNAGRFTDLQSLYGFGDRHFSELLTAMNHANTAIWRELLFAPSNRDALPAAFYRAAAPGTFLFSSHR